MNDGLRDLSAVAGCIRLAAALPAAIRLAWVAAPALVEAFELVVDPMVEQTITYGVARDAVRDALCYSGVKVGYMISGYARMAGLPMDHELAVLGGAFARLYDDLIDDIEEPAGGRLDDRLADLFQGRDFFPASELEELLQQLYSAMEVRLQRPREDPIYAALGALHEYQRLSRRQTDPTTSRESLGKITSGKGGLANVALIALIRPRMSPPERELMMEVGETFQLLDDYLDADLDRRLGITTLVVLGPAGLTEIASRLRALRPRLYAFYGRKGTAQFVSVLYFLLAAALGKRRRPARAGRQAGNRRYRRRAPLWILVSRGDGVVPRRTL